MTSKKTKPKKEMGKYLRALALTGAILGGAALAVWGKDCCTGKPQPETIIKTVEKIVYVPRCPDAGVPDTMPAEPDMLPDQKAPEPDSKPECPEGKILRRGKCITPSKCRNGKVDPGEQCGEPGLDKCDETQKCRRCKCVDKPKKPEKSCSIKSASTISLAASTKFGLFKKVLGGVHAFSTALSGQSTVNVGIVVCPNGKARAYTADISDKGLRRKVMNSVNNRLRKPVKVPPTGGPVKFTIPVPM